MAVTISELIGKKEEIRAKKKNLYDLETSLGDMTFKIPNAQLITESWDMQGTLEGNKYLIFECAVDPNLKDSELQRSFGCAEPLDIVEAIFQAGEISRIAGTLLTLANFKNEKIAHKLHREVKNE